MTRTRLGIDDYPLAEKRPDAVRGRGDQGLDAITFDAVLEGRVTLDDLRITGASLRQQGEISRAAGRSTLAENFERAAELTEVPQDVIMRTYELLRPGRATSKAELLAAASVMRETYAAHRIAAFIEEAADVYERRGLFSRRF